MRSFFLKGLLGLTTALGLIVFVASISLWAGLFHASIAPNYSYRFSEPESVRLGRALDSLHERMADGDYDSIRDELVEARIPAAQNIEAMRASVENFGPPIDSEFFRSSEPEPASKYFKGVDGTFYSVYYFTRTPTGEYFETVDWIVGEIGPPKIRSYSATKIVAWQEENREREKMLAENFDHEVRIPIAGNIIDIRY